MKQQSPTQLFMVEPACFYTNTQTTDSNHYQSDDSDQSKAKKKQREAEGKKARKNIQVELRKTS